MSRRRGGGKDPEPSGGVPAVYEGPEVLSALLERAGSPSTTEEVVAIFTRAQKAGEPRAAIIPTLFPAEPRFTTPEDARRLYGNLFGLWARLASGLGAHDDAPEVVDEPAAPPELPERGSQRGDTLAPEVVEAVWKHLAASPPREVQRRRDRFVNAQPDLIAWLEGAPLPEVGGVAAHDLAFEAWAMFDQAFGERLRTVEYRDLRSLEAEPPPLGELQPALAAYVAEQLDTMADENPPLGPEDRAQLERALAAVGAALTGAVVEPS
ncbi:MAG: hypothetical protein QM767_24940 [Anaeromyxobacter sp.]